MLQIGNSHQRYDNNTIDVTIVPGRVALSQEHDRSQREQGALAVTVRRQRSNPEGIIGLCVLFPVALRPVSSATEVSVSALCRHCSVVDQTLKV